MTEPRTAHAIVTHLTRSAASLHDNIAAEQFKTTPRHGFSYNDRLVREARGGPMEISLLIFAVGSVAALELWRVKVEGDERAVAHARLKLGKELRGQAARVINEQVARVIRLGTMLGRNKASADAGEFETVLTLLAWTDLVATTRASDVEC